MKKPSRLLCRIIVPYLLSPKRDERRAKACIEVTQWYPEDHWIPCVGRSTPATLRMRDERDTFAMDRAHRWAYYEGANLLA